jgi:hypothetical protein
MHSCLYRDIVTMMQSMIIMVVTLDKHVFKGMQRGGIKVHV